MSSITLYSVATQKNWKP